MDMVRLHHCRRIDLLHWLLANIDAIVDDKQRVRSAQDLVVETDTI